MSDSIAPRRWAALTLLGVAVGARSFTPAAAVALRRKSTPVALRRGLLLAAAGEYGGDKVPQAPARTSPQGVGGRLAAGAAVGWVLAGPRGAALVGSTAAAAGAGLATLRGAFGARTGKPDFVIALAEDALALGLTAAVVDAAIG